MPRPYANTRTMPNHVRPRAIADRRMIRADGLGTSPPATPMPIRPRRETARRGAGVSAPCAPTGPGEGGALVIDEPTRSGGGPADRPPPAPTSTAERLRARRSVV